MDTFNEDWIPDREMKTEDSQNDVKTVRMGDGVIQSIAMTIGAPLKVYNLTFTQRPETITKIETFLDQHKARRFLWRPPFEKRPIIVIHSEKSTTRTGFADTLTVKFTEVSV